MNKPATDGDDQFYEPAGDNRPLSQEDACPGCGGYYVLVCTAPTPPAMLAEYGTDEDLEAWDADHDYNILECSACGWSSDDD